MKSTGLRKDFPSVVDIAYEQYVRDLSRYKQVKDIMSTNVITISPEASMDQAADIMGENHIGSLIVSKYNTPVGIVTERDFLSKVLAYEKIPKDTRVEAVMSYPLITIASTAKIKEAARLMMSKKSRLAVFDSGRIVGVVTASDLIRSLPDVPETEAKVDDFMTKEIVTADEKTPVNEIIKLMSENHIGSVIVTTQGEHFGIFTERDLLSTFLLKSKPLTAEVGRESSSPLITTVAGTSIHRAAALMALKHIRRLPIAAEDKLMGIITARDLVEVYAK